jgi:hypothetical protein
MKPPLDARDAAKFVYDAAKSAARIHRVKGARDDVVRGAHQLQGDALKIEARAKYRLAEEYDAAHGRGEVRGQGGSGSNQFGNIPDQNVSPTLAEIGLSSKTIFEARQVRDAEKETPGLVEATVDAILAAGREPTKSEVTKASRCRPRFPPTRNEKSRLCKRRLSHNA